MQKRSLDQSVMRTGRLAYTSVKICYFFRFHGFVRAKLFNRGGILYAVIEFTVRGVVCRLIPS